MQPVTTTVRVPRAARILAAVSLAICIVALTVNTERTAALGLALGALFGLAALVAYVLAPKRTVVLLEVRGDELFVTSQTDPLRMEIGRLYEPVANVPIASIRKLVTRTVYLGRGRHFFVDVSLTRFDGTMESIFFPGELLDEVRAFFGQLRERWPTVEYADDGYHHRITWRSPLKASLRPLLRWTRGAS